MSKTVSERLKDLIEEYRPKPNINNINNNNRNKSQTQKTFLKISDDNNNISQNINPDKIEINQILQINNNNNELNENNIQPNIIYEGNNLIFPKNPFLLNYNKTEKIKKDIKNVRNSLKETLSQSSSNLLYLNEQLSPNKNDRK